MRHNKLKKGFTLVELLVVIAILAILATVSIVGYSSFTKKAKYSNDVTLVTEWNQLLDAKDVLAQSSEDEKLENIVEVKDFFKENGTYDSTFTPASSGYHFYWSETDNNVYLVEDDNSNFTVSYPEDEENTNVTKDNSYRLDLSYCPISTTIAGVTLNRSALVVGEDNEVTISGNSIPTTIVIGTETLKVTAGKFSITPSGATALAVEQDPTIYISNVAIDPSDKSITFGTTFTLLPVITPNNATTQTVTWSSLDETIASVDQTGKVTANKAGTTTIKAVATDFLDTYTGECTFTVLPAKIEKPSETAETFTYTGSEQTYTLTENENYTISDNKRTNAGSQTVTVALKDKVNYQWADSTTADLTFTFTINKADATITTTGVTKEYTYTGSEQTINSGATVDSGATLTYTNNTFTDRPSDGKQMITISAAETANYKATSTTVEITINKADATITTTGVTKEYTYTGSEQTVNSGATVDSGATLTYTNNKFTDRPSNGKQIVTISAAETANYNAASTTVEITINKATQNIAAPTKASSTSSSVKLNAVSAGQGNTKYGYNTTNTAPATWQDGVEFTTGLTPNTTYYFFAKYEGTGNYNEAISTGTAIKTDALKITPIQQGTSTKVTFLPAFTNNAGLKAVMGTATFCDKDGNDYDVLNNAASMSDLGTKISNLGVSNVYVKGTPAKAFYGIYDVDWNTAFGSGTTASDFCDTFKTTLKNAGLPTTNVYTGSENWNRSNTSVGPTLNGVNYSDFYSSENGYLSINSLTSSNSKTPYSSTKYNANCPWFYSANDSKWEWMGSGTKSVVLTYSFN